jgi:hypothetical protein
MEHVRAVWQDSKERRQVCKMFLLGLRIIEQDIDLVMVMMGWMVMERVEADCARVQILPAVLVARHARDGAHQLQIQRPRRQSVHVHAFVTRSSSCIIFRFFSCFGFGFYGFGFCLQVWLEGTGDDCEHADTCCWEPGRDALPRGGHQECHQSSHATNLKLYT